MRALFGNCRSRRGFSRHETGKKQALMPHDRAEKTSVGAERVTPSHRTEDEIGENKSDCPLWNSFAAAREDGVRTTDAFLEALRAQTIFALRLIR
jgi:hypothetical protein